MLHAVVDVAFLYNYDVAFEKVEVCRLQRGETKNGVGIFVSFLFSSGYTLLTTRGSRLPLFPRTVLTTNTRLIFGSLSTFPMA